MAAPAAMAPTPLWLNTLSALIEELCGQPEHMVDPSQLNTDCQPRSTKSVDSQNTWESPSWLSTDCQPRSYTNEVRGQPKHMDGPSPSQMNTDCQP